VAYHTAFEYHGLANQVYYEVYAASDTRFRDFEHDGLVYRRVASPFNNGVETKADGARVTNLERTVIDGINSFDKAGGLEELLRCIELLPMLDHNKLTEYLQCYDKSVLYQKTGYILEHFKDVLKLPDEFFALCRSKITKSKRYLERDIQDKQVFNKDWALFVPEDLMSITQKGVYHDERL
jgi:predicted transcriptional regulator of viral defense system